MDERIHGRTGSPKSQGRTEGARRASKKNGKYRVLVATRHRRRGGLSGTVTRASGATSCESNVARHGRTGLHSTG